PTRGDHIVGNGSMSGESHSKAGVALSIQIFSHPAHFFGSACEPMNEQARRFGAVTQKEKGLRCWNDPWHVGIIDYLQRRIHAGRSDATRRYTGQFSAWAPGK